MKKTSLSLILGLTLFTSCKKEDIGTSATLQAPAALSVAVKATVTTGSWRVSYFFDNGDETANFAGYTFTFAANGTITAVKTGSTVTGSWSTGSDDSTAKLFLTFTSPANFTDLSDDWHVITRTDTKITLQDVSGGNGGTDYLTFERN